MNILQPLRRGAARYVATAIMAAAACAPASSMHLTDLQGKVHTLEGYRGNWVVLNVWATWCAPCIKEMPELEALSHTRPDLVVTSDWRRRATALPACASSPGRWASAIPSLQALPP
jgi:hypothetical protein